MVAILGDGILIDQLTRTHNNNDVIKTVQANQTIETLQHSIPSVYSEHFQTINVPSFYPVTALYAAAIIN